MIDDDHQMYIKNNIDQLDSDEKAGLFEIVKDLVSSEQLRMGKFQFKLNLLSYDQGFKLHSYIIKCLKKRHPKIEYIDSVYESFINN